MEFDATLLRTVRTMRWETEWFVQQSCERIREGSGSAFWGSTLRRIKDHKLCVVTTNYDRSFEMACQRSGVLIDDGFEAFEDREYSRWKGIDQSSPIKLLKIHGSTDWYQGDFGQVYKLKHPLPIYGDLTVSGHDGEVPRLSSAMILPTREKIINRPPYPDLVTEFRISTRTSDMAVFLGTSLRDPDILDVFMQCQRNIPTLLVNAYDPRTDLGVTGNAIFIQESASQFLISTFPKILDRQTHQSVAFLDDIDSSGFVSVLDWIEILEDSDVSVDELCGTIERLADCEISVDGMLIRGLIGHREPAVRRYALCLIPYSVDREEAMELAENHVSGRDDPAFAEELELLKSMSGLDKSEDEN